MKKIFLACSLALIVSSCSSHYSSVIRPESLISASAEKISFPISDSASVMTIENWVSGGDVPTDAEVSCVNGNPSCLSVKKFLKNSHIPFKEVAPVDASSSRISLIYDSLIARGCDANSFGCSTSLNAIRMVTNREQFIKPALSDFQDAAVGVTAINKMK